LGRGEAAAQQQRLLRRELLSGIAPAQRHRFADATVEVLSDADFTRLTRNPKAPAVTIVEGGKARVLLRERAHPRALREEGIHLLQSVDPRTRRAVRRLDERRLAKWDDLHIDEQFSLYRTKVELEIDAQQRLLRGLGDDLATAADDVAARQALEVQREIAGDNLFNLQRRLHEVDSVGPRERLEIAQGRQPRPRYLEKEPPRLFAKDPVGSERRRLYRQLGNIDPSHKVRAKEIFSTLGQRSHDELGLREVKNDLIRTAATLSQTNPSLAWDYVSALGELLDAVPRDTIKIVRFLEASLDMPARANILKSVRDIVVGGRIRLYKLSEFGEKIALMSRDDASEFVRRIRDAQAIPSDNAKGLHEAFEDLKQFAQDCGLNTDLVDEIAEEVTRTGSWSWGAFRARLGGDYAASSGFQDLEAIISTRVGWEPADIGPIRHWAGVLKMLHTELGDAFKQKDLMDAVEALLGSFEKGYTYDTYQRFRHFIRNRIVNHVIKGRRFGRRTSQEQMGLLRRFLAEVKEVDSASKGALFTEYRRRLLERGGRPAGEFTNIKNIPNAALKLPNNKTADGAVHVLSGRGPGRPEAGDYLVDDKAGRQAFDAKQAERYSDLLDASNLTTEEGRRSYRGLIYIFENFDAAEGAVRHLDANDRNPNIFVAVFDETTGRLKFLPRTARP
ncbi:MAG: hypothetical protein ACR2RB_10760, partial [Gammaproteobacteria bacterium]